MLPGCPLHRDRDGSTCRVGREDGAVQCGWALGQAWGWGYSAVGVGVNSAVQCGWGWGSQCGAYEMLPLKWVDAS